MQLLLHPFGQGLDVQRLGQEGHTRLVLQQVREIALGIARDEHDRRVAQIFARLLQQGRPVQPRHDDVRDHHVDLAGVFLGQQQGLLAVGGLDHLIAALAQQAGGDAAHRGLVLDEQDAAGAGEVAGHRALG
jgi:hypothetical protein